MYYMVQECGRPGRILAGVPVGGVINAMVYTLEVVSVVVAVAVVVEETTV